MPLEDNFEQVWASYQALIASKAATTFTKTFNTPSTTIAAATAAAVATTASTTTTPYGYSTQAQADAIPVAINALEADVAALRELAVGIVDVLQAIGAAA